MELDGPNVRIADYFDVIAGTSTGGLITTMLTVLGPDNRPLYAAKNISSFYFEHSPKIFPVHLKKHYFEDSNLIGGPKYDGRYLKTLVEGLLGNVTISQTLTNVVVLIFDLKRLQPVVFTTNDNFMAITYITKEVLLGKFDRMGMQPMDSKEIFLLSLDTDIAKLEEKYNAKDVARLGSLSWVYNNGSTPTSHSEYKLSSDASSSDISTKENMQTLMQIGEDLLKKRVSRVNLETGRPEPIQGDGTNKQALVRFAKLFSDARKF
ncbi:hypothetical protein OROMI_011276 [Orobanche minor]